MHYEHNHETHHTLTFDEKLVKLLEHWIKHNNDHAENYRNLAKKTPYTKNTHTIASIRCGLKNGFHVNAAHSLAELINTIYERTGIKIELNRAEGDENVDFMKIYDSFDVTKCFYKIVRSHFKVTKFHV